MAKARQLDFDVARGIAIILVVFGHALVGAIAFLGDGPVARFLLITIYTFHMPVFFLVTGILTSRSKKIEPGKIARRSTLRIAYPYVLWSVILWFFNYIASDYTNGSVGMFSLDMLLWNPVAVMWFLYVLFFITIIVGLLAPMDGRLKLALGVAAYVGSHFVEAHPLILQTLRFGGITLFGAGMDVQAFLRFASRPAVLLISTAVFIAGSVLTWQKAVAGPIVGYPAFDLIYTPCTISGVMALIGVSRLLLGADGSEARNAISRFLAYAGQRTMPIYVTHILITAGARIALAQVGLAEFPLILLVGTLLGVVLPLVAYEIAEKLRLGTVLGWK